MIAERLATRRAQIASPPTPALGMPDASPTRRARAGASASTESDLPLRRRVCRLVGDLDDLVAGGAEIAVSPAP